MFSARANIDNTRRNEEAEMRRVHDLDDLSVFIAKGGAVSSTAARRNQTGSSSIQ
jgi:hypothetical protein